MKQCVKTVSTFIIKSFIIYDDRCIPTCKNSMANMPVLILINYWQCTLFEMITLVNKSQLHLTLIESFIQFIVLSYKLIYQFLCKEMRWIMKKWMREQFSAWNYLLHFNKIALKIHFFFLQMRSTHWLII